MDSKIYLFDSKGELYEYDDGEVARLVRLIPPHFSAHQIPAEESQAAYGQPDPGILNITAGGGILPYTTNAQQLLNSRHATTAEIRTLPDPIKAFQFINFTLVERVAQNLVMRCSTPIWIAAALTQPNVAQNGQFVNFTSVNHTISLQSVPCTKTSFTGTQSTFVNLTGFRWMVQISDGPTVT